MKIYFSASISGGRKYLDTYKKIVHYLKMKNHIVLTEHIVLDNLLELEEKLTPQMVYKRDISLLTESDIIIAEVSNPSLGVGYEIQYGLQLEKPTLCVYQKGLRISWMILGNTSPFITVKAYKDHKSLFEQLQLFLDNQK